MALARKRTKRTELWVDTVLLVTPFSAAFGSEPPNSCGLLPWEIDLVLTRKTCIVCVK